MKANEMQIGGNHYASEYQHWDLVIAVGMGYLEAQATRYIARWRKKNGLEDLQKSLHYINKLLEVIPQYRKPVQTGLSLSDIHREVERFSDANSLTDCESSAVWLLASWGTDEVHLVTARDLVLLLMDEAEPQPVPLEDSNKHAERGSRGPHPDGGWGGGVST